MPNFTTLTLEQMRVAKPADVVAQLTAFFSKMTLAQLIRFSFDADTVTKTLPLTHRPDGQVSVMETVERDIETNAVVKRTRWEYDYYEDEPGKPVKDLVTRVLSPVGAEVERRTLRHFKDGRQPEELQVAEPIGEVVGP